MCRASGVYRERSRCSLVRIHTRYRGQHQFFGNVVIREIEPYEIQAQYPYPQGLMMPGKDRVRQIIKASLTGLAHVALTLGLRVVTPLLRQLTTLTPWTTDTVWPA